MRLHKTNREKQLKMIEEVELYVERGLNSYQLRGGGEVDEFGN